MTSITKKRKKTETKLSIEKENSHEEPNKVERQLMISEAAYYRAEQRGFTPDQETDDWLEAEKQIEEILNAA